MNPDSAHVSRNASIPTQLDEWLARQGWQAFDFQVEAWSAYLAGQSGLLNAPTGVGKTLAVAMGPICEWLNRDDRTVLQPIVPNPSRRARKPSEPITVLWITPLRALAADTVKALSLPVEEMRIPWSVELRTGDTSSSVKRRQLSKLPTVIVTTPESLSLLLTYPETRENLSTLKLIVVDEWHELLGSKRGVQVELALARLRTWVPNLRIWGLSATISNPASALDVLTGGAGGKLIFGQIPKELEISTIIPERIDRFPWSGHLGRLGVPGVAEALIDTKTSLIFTNTRNQAELWFQWLSLYEPDWEDEIALHHGSVDRVERERVEGMLTRGELRAVVCTSSLDLGVDFPTVDQVIQIGSPKGIARLMQRAGRSGHRPDGKSRILCVPTNAFELIEFAAAREASARGAIEPRVGLTRSLDVLVQHLVTCALGGGFRSLELLAEVRTTHAFVDITQSEWNWSLDFVTHGGTSLSAYPEYQKVVEHDGVFLVENPAIARFHRLSVGTITGDSMVAVQYLKGATLGQIEESFIARLKPGDRFTIAGRTVEYVRIKEMKVFVRKADGQKGVVPKWLGGRLPLSSELAAAVREKLDEANNGIFDSSEMGAVRSVLAVQQQWSKLPARDELLVERTKTREGHHIFLYPFAGRFVHDGLAALLAFRLTRDHPRGISAAATDYGIELVCDEFVQVDDWSELFSKERLLDDLATCLNAAELARRQFREIARVSGLVFSGYPSAQKAARQLQASSGLLYDVFNENDPGNLLLDQARREVLQGQLDLSRLQETLTRMLHLHVVEMTTERLTPLAFPIWAERLQATVSTEKFTDRIKRMVVQLEKAVKW